MTNTPNHDIYLQLSDPFPVEMERTVNKSGRALTYLPIAEVINKMNKVIGVGNWSSEVIDVRRDALDPDWVIAHVRVTVTMPHPIINDRVVATYDGVGGQQVKRKKTGDIVDLGDEFKGAVSDALKKALQQIGLGLSLARTEDAMYADEAYEQPVVQEKKSVAVGGVNPEVWATFSSHLAKMDKGEKDALSEWWAQTYPGEKKPTQSSATDAQVEACISECVRIQLNGEYVEQ
jgi:hypothetical protein